MGSSKRARRRRQQRRRALIEKIRRKDRQTPEYEYWHSVALLMDPSQAKQELDAVGRRTTQARRRKKQAFVDALAEQCYLPFCPP